MSEVVRYEPRPPFVVQVGTITGFNWREEDVVIEWEFHSAHADQSTARLVANDIAQHNEYVRVIDRSLP